jgi:hypothetical protein
MADLIYGPDLERSMQLYELLYKSGKLCTVPDCPQQKSYLNDSDLCHAHQKVNDGLLSLQVQIGGSIYENYQ